MRVRKSGPRNSFGRFKPPRLNARGFSLMEIMVTVGILGVVAIGTSVLFSDMFAIQKRAAATPMIQAMRQEIIDAITKSNTSGAASAWTVMVGSAAQNPDLSCIRDNTLCTKYDSVAAPSAEYAMNVMRADGSEIFYSRTANRGFRLDGTLCSTFNAASGDPLCPFRWDIRYRFHCVGTEKVSCENPTVQAIGTLLYSPGSNSPVNTGFNVQVYAFDVRRGDKPDLNNPFTISYVMNTNAGEGSGNTCATTWHPRLLNTITGTPGIATLVGTNRFSLPPGGYDCRIQAPAFKNGSNRIRLQRFSGAVSNTLQTSGPAVASLTGGSATVSLQTTFVLNVTTQFEVQHWCSDANPTYSLGVPAASDSGYTGTTFTIVACVKTS